MLQTCDSNAGRATLAHDCLAPPDAHTRHVDEPPELTAILGYGSAFSALHAIRAELIAPRGVRRVGRVEGLAPMDLLTELRDPLLPGELVTVRLLGDSPGVRLESVGIVHWQRNCAGRWLAGLFLRESLPQSFLQHVWMDMRKELRFPVRIPLDARLGSQRRRVPVVVLDYSRSGLRLETDQQPTVGQRVELFERDLLAAGIIRFVHPAPRGQRYQVGCEFANNEGIRISRLAVSLVDSVAQVGVDTWHS